MNKEVEIGRARLVLLRARIGISKHLAIPGACLQTVSRTFDFDASVVEPKTVRRIHDMMASSLASSFQKRTKKGSVKAETEPLSAKSLPQMDQTVNISSSGSPGRRRQFCTPEEVFYKFRLDNQQLNFPHQIRDYNSKFQPIATSHLGKAVCWPGILEFRQTETA